jgi:hypothetical protein
VLSLLRWWHAEKRESVVREIVTTERNYIRILQAVLDLYQGPLEAKARAKKKWITEDQVKAIFYQIKGTLHSDHQRVRSCARAVVRVVR